MTEHKNNHVTMNFTMIMSQFAWVFLPVVDPGVMAAGCRSDLRGGCFWEVYNVLVLC